VKTIAENEEEKLQLVRGGILVRMVPYRTVPYRTHRWIGKEEMRFFKSEMGGEDLRSKPLLHIHK
jgi:hypothetical protein